MRPCGTASPGSIIAYLMMTPGSDIWKVLVGVGIATGVSFAVASPIVKMAGGKNSLEAAQAEMAAMKEAKGQTVQTEIKMHLSDQKRSSFV